MIHKYINTMYERMYIVMYLLLFQLQIFRENHYDSMKGTRYAAALVEANGNFVRMWFKNSLPQIENILKEEMQKNSSLIA